MRVGDILLEAAIRNRFDLEVAIANCHPDDFRQKEKLQNDWWHANQRVQFISQMVSEEATP